MCAYCSGRCVRDCVLYVCLFGVGPIVCDCVLVFVGLTY